jgi:hypothetical protein
MLVSAEPNLHNALLGCYKIALHFGSAETQYPMHRIDQSRGGIDLLRSDEEVYLASKHILLTRKIGGDDNTVSTPLFTIYGLAVTVSSKEWCGGPAWIFLPADFTYNTLYYFGTVTILQN